MKTNKKTLHKPEGIRRVVYEDYADCYIGYPRYPLDGESHYLEYLEGRQYYKITKLYKGDKLLRQFEEKIEPPEYWQNLIREAKNRTEVPMVTEVTPPGKKLGFLRRLLGKILDGVWWYL